MSGERPLTRGRLRVALERYFEKRRSPRFMLALIILLTGLVGFGLSYFLLKAGVTSMAIRYPVALVLAYGVFLVAIRAWAAVERRRFDPNDPEVQELLASAEEPIPRAVPKDDSKWYDWLDFTSGLDVGEGCLPGILMAAVIGLVALLVAAIGAAPVLIAEVFLDVVLTGLLYRHLRVAATEHWLGTAIRKTLPYALGAAALLAIAGLALDLLAPESDTVGRAIKELFPNP